ncbi:hypothetical protein [Nocardia anaemiae]|uniref:hypothetical protein n=1 Tax=Nocardia anaemiae TaxID=263910 RepID=UPI0012F4C201|nr:hypothetical protein [Nocardia anaemiae]
MTIAKLVRRGEIGAAEAAETAWARAALRAFDRPVGPIRVGWSVRVVGRPALASRPVTAGRSMTAGRPASART